MGLTTEAKGHRELVQHGGLPRVATYSKEEWPGMSDIYIDGRTIPPACPSRGCSAASFWQCQLLVLMLQ